jgi:hypothetical protein
VQTGSVGAFNGVYFLFALRSVAVWAFGRDGELSCHNSAQGNLIVTLPRRTHQDICSIYVLRSTSQHAEDHHTSDISLMGEDLNELTCYYKHKVQGRVRATI